MERDLRLGLPEERQQVEIDIRKILEQMGLDKERWPHEWRDRAEEKLNA